MKMGKSRSITAGRLRQRLPDNIGDRSQVLLTFLDSSTIDPAKLSELIERIDRRNYSRV
jgi:hypothetical protein